MNRFAPVAVAIAMSLSVSAPVFAGDAAGQSAQPSQSAQLRPTAQRVVMLCDNDTATRRSFERLHGSAPQFVTADEALTARASGETWAKPRCMSAREHARLVSRLSAYAAVR